MHPERENQRDLSRLPKFSDLSTLGAGIDCAGATEPQHHIYNHQYYYIMAPSISPTISKQYKYNTITYTRFFDIFNSREEGINIDIIV